MHRSEYPDALVEAADALLWDHELTSMVTLEWQEECPDCGYSVSSLAHREGCSG